MDIEHIWPHATGSAHASMRDGRRRQSGHPNASVLAVFPMHPQAKTNAQTPDPDWRNHCFPRGDLWAFW